MYYQQLSIPCYLVSFYANNYCELLPIVSTAFNANLLISPSTAKLSRQGRPVFFSGSPGLQTFWGIPNNLLSFVCLFTLVGWPCKWFCVPCSSYCKIAQLVVYALHYYGFSLISTTQGSQTIQTPVSTSRFHKEIQIDLKVPANQLQLLKDTGHYWQLSKTTLLTSCIST